MACRVCHYKNLQINPFNGQVSQLSGQSYGNGKLFSAAGQIVSEYIKTISVGTNRIVLQKADC